MSWFDSLLSQGRDAAAQLSTVWSASDVPADFVPRIRTTARSLTVLSDTLLRQKATHWREHATEHPVETERLIEGFALVGEAARRAIGYTPYDVQYAAAFHLYHGRICEMATGEGKSLTATLPAFTRLGGKRTVHIATSNTYLATRDAESFAPLFAYLGATTSSLRDRQPLDEKRRAYAADIVFAAGYEFGFDYLRDQLTLLKAPHDPIAERTQRLLGKTPATPTLIQPKLHFTIIDEIDSVLIDDGRTPLILSAPASDKADPAPYLAARRVADALEEDHIELDPSRRSVLLSESGWKQVYLPANMPPVGLVRPWHEYVLNALRAQHYFHRDVHYVVAGGKIELVDESTGRRFADRTLRNGLHQAIEAHEKIEIRPESGSEASITRQRFVTLYESACGMTGTAREVAGEFKHLFELPVIPIAPRLPSKHQIWPEAFFATKAEKISALVAEVAELHKAGRPILLGTRTIEQSEEIAAALESAGLHHRLLNARQDKEEADIIATAGRPGALTVATNMAGRGTHIDVPKESLESGGLHVIGFERHESKRLDRQLTGRGGRQGQPGTARFFTSAEDEWLAHNEPELAGQLKVQIPTPDFDAAEWSHRLDGVQDRIERDMSAARISMVRHDRGLEDLRKRI
jgi:preprotein translocase subunit SecA